MNGELIERHYATAADLARVRAAAAILGSCLDKTARKLGGEAYELSDRLYAELERVQAEMRGTA